MNLDKGKATSDDYFDRAMNWDASRTLQLEKSTRRAWWVATAFGATTVLSVAAVAFIASQQEVQPFLYRVDEATGVPEIITLLDDVTVSGDEVQDKYWLAQYVRSRETYDWYTIEADYNRVGLMSARNVGADYAAQFVGDDALDKIWGDKVRANAEIVSVVPGDGSSATVRFRKTTERVNGAGSPDVTRWIATIGYTYDTSLSIRESMRLINPFGFRVTSYRVDPELVGGGS